jgi:hypothetical protein
MFVMTFEHHFVGLEKKGEEKKEEMRQTGENATVTFRKKKT